MRLLLMSLLFLNFFELLELIDLSLLVCIYDNDNHKKTLKITMLLLCEERKFL